MRNVEKRGVNFRGSIYSVKEGSIRTEYPANDDTWVVEQNIRLFIGILKQMKKIRR
jgi:hypothetical protein